MNCRPALIQRMGVSNHQSHSSPNTIWRWLSLSLLLVLLPAKAITFRVGLEPFPPLITPNGRGMTVKLLDTIDQRLTDHRLKIMIMPYNRAKKELKEGRLDMIGHTPYQNETQAFYRYAEDIDWSIPAPLDIYSIAPQNLQPEHYRKLDHIGTPRGNEVFLAELLSLSPQQFFATGNIDNLVEMMGIGRLPAFVFARAPTFSTIQQLNLRGVHYRNLVTLKASLAVAKTPQGQILKTLMEQTITELDIHQLFEHQYHFNDKPEQGIVPVNISHP